MKIFLMLLLLTLIVSCQHNNESNNRLSEKDSLLTQANQPVILVYNFFGTHRCPSCIAIEEATKKTLETYFQNELKQGKIKQYSVNVDEEKNSQVCEKYQAFGSGIVIARIDNSKDTSINLTSEGFKYALKKQEKFIEILKSHISNLLK
ncbi:MAG: nitrophenyl compound nitroreductase subunit ArsF family protein [Bacteroidales bacterium]|nr:nitrophenyl compound nitroreductase subunit ArsF family protein [Bacteroidales bacterium]